ncbi:MAG: LysE family translocator [Chloroflexota bacterium]
MESWSSLLIFITVAAILLITPGPAVLFIVTRSMEQGRLAGIVSALGIGFGSVIHVIAAAMGLSALLLTSVLAFNIVKIAGALYLVYLGIRTLFEKSEVDAVIEVDRRTPRELFVEGSIVQVLNPKSALFIFAFLPQFISPNSGSVAVQTLILGTLFILMAILSDSCYALLAGTARRWLMNNRGFISARRYVAGTVYIGLGFVTAFAGSGQSK